MPNQLDNAHLTRLGTSDLFVSRIGLGCWPMSGISSLGVTDEQSVATIRAALDQGINFFDTAYSYGYDGRSDRVLREALGKQREKAIIAHKVGTHWDAQNQRVVDGRPATLIQHAQECLKRLGTDYVDVMYLHCADPNVPIEESAGAIGEICHRGWSRYAAVSNVTREQATKFATVCPIVAFQPYFNMFQQDAVKELLPFATQHNISMVCYWVLMKGLLSGRLTRDHVFDPDDRRLTYPIFQGQAWQDAQDVLDQLRRIANELDITVSQLVVAWSLTRPGVSVALLGAKRPEQIIESAQTMYMQFAPEWFLEIEESLNKPSAIGQ
jgi:aryl-alcohol dehydrogenase-like predicted oxidoreductase